MFQRPERRPFDPRFSSGPTRKRPGWEFDALKAACIGRSHRSEDGREKLATAIKLTRNILRIPDDYALAIVPGSDTGAVEMAMWTLLGPRKVEVAAWEAFGEEWIVDALEELRLDTIVHRAPYGALPDLDAIDTVANDVVFTWNGTAAGVRVPDADWIASDRSGIVICDATSAAFAMPLDWQKLDVVTFSWQKGLGSEAAHGMLVLSPRALDRLDTYDPPRAIPKLFRLKRNGRRIESLFSGETINTPSMLAVEDYLDALGWAEAIGGLDALHARVSENATVLFDWIERTPWVANLAREPATRSTTGVCMVLCDPELASASEKATRALVQRMVARLADAGVAFDIASHRDAPVGLRIWCGATVESNDLRILTDWLEWAYREETSAFSRVAAAETSETSRAASDSRARSELVFAMK